jgi:predicted transcriptional regulator
MGQEQFEILLDFFKALGNGTRLKIMGILANGECTVSELAAMLELREPTISQHLQMLQHVGLVDMRVDGNHHIYSFNNRALINMSKEVFSREQIAALVPNIEEVKDSWDRKVLQTFFDGERLTQIPASNKKLQVILRWLVEKFEFGKQYTEKQVNEIINRYHPDHATLRRELINYQYMRRERGIYWRLPARNEQPEVAQD